MYSCRLDVSDLHPVPSDPVPFHIVLSCEPRLISFRPIPRVTSAEHLSYPFTARSKPETFTDQAGEILDQMWPVILVIGVMMTMQWAVTFYFGAAKASSYILPGYLTLVAGGAAFHLSQEGNLEKVQLGLVEGDPRLVFVFLETLLESSSMLEI